MKIFQVDSFTDKAFSGNPAGVCILDREMEDSWLKNVAKEMNLSETAFLLKKGDTYSLRWFTPSVEVDLCGHATLAVSHILWEQGYESEDSKLEFITRSGLLSAEKNGQWIELDFPMEPEREAEVPQELISALGAEPKHVGKNRFDYLVELESEAIVRGLRPDFKALAKLPARGIVVTSIASNKDYDFVSRFFCPAIAIDEDPVTGSAHCCLGPYWMRRLNKKEFLAYQASERGGVLKVKVEADRVILSGRAVTVIKGEILG